MVKRISVALALGSLLIGSLIWSYWNMSQERRLEAEIEAPVFSESRVGRSKAGMVTLTLNPDAPVRMGLRTAVVTAAPLVKEIIAYGQVLDPAPLIAQVRNLALAEATLNYAIKAYERAKRLHERDKSVSTSELDDLEETTQKARVNLKAARQQFLSDWGQDLAARPDLPSLVEALAARKTALVSASLPIGEAAPAHPAKARVQSASSKASAEAIWAGPAPRTDPAWQGSCYLVLVSNTNTAVQWSPGLAVQVALRQSETTKTGVHIPGTAVVRHNGRTWVYVAADDGRFERREIALDQPMANDWIASGSVQPGETLVVTGAQALLSEEGKMQIQMAD